MWGSEFESPKSQVRVGTVAHAYNSNDPVVRWEVETQEPLSVHEPVTLAKQETLPQTRWKAGMGTPGCTEFQTHTCTGKSMPVHILTHVINTRRRRSTWRTARHGCACPKPQHWGGSRRDTTQTLSLATRWRIALYRWHSTTVKHWLWPGWQSSGTVAGRVRAGWGQECAVSWWGVWLTLWHALAKTCQKTRVDSVYFIVCKLHPSEMTMRKQICSSPPLPEEQKAQDL